MSSVTKREPVQANIMEPLLDGGFRAETVSKSAWRCDGCGLVWPMKHQAVDCESRRHVSHYQQRYVSGAIINGRAQYERFYDRDAIRREAVASATA